MNSSLLSIKDLVKSYDGKTNALDHLDLELSDGEFVVVIGPSGSGKSTLIRSINHLVEPTSGDIMFDGQDLSTLSKKELRKTRTKIGMIFQNYNLIDRSNVLKNVLHGKLGKLSQWETIFGRFSQEDKEQAVALLQEVGLEDHLYKRADELSGGQMQRVGICRALMQEPKLLLADEPIASLDPASSKVVMDQLYRITQRQGLTCIVNLHQVEVAKEYATRIIGIHKGKVVFNGKPTELTDEMISHIYENKLAEAVGVPQPVMAY